MNSTNKIFSLVIFKLNYADEDGQKLQKQLLGFVCPCVVSYLFLLEHLTCFPFQIYPDEGHFLSRRSRIQLTYSLIGYFRGCLLDVSSLLDRQQDED